MCACVCDWHNAKWGNAKSEAMQIANYDCAYCTLRAARYALHAARCTVHVARCTFRIGLEQTISKISIGVGSVLCDGLRV